VESGQGYEDTLNNPHFIKSESQICFDNSYKPSCQKTTTRKNKKNKNKNKQILEEPSISISSKSDKLKKDSLDALEAWFDQE